MSTDEMNQLNHSQFATFTPDIELTEATHITQAKTNFQMLNEIMAIKQDIKRLECRIANLEAENFVLEFRAKREAKTLKGLADDIERDRDSRY